MIRWLLRILKDQSGFVLVPGFYPYRDEGGEGGRDNNFSDDDDSGDDDFDPRGGGEDGEDGEGGEGGDDEGELDDGKVLEFLKKKGLEFESLDHLTSVQKNLSGVTTKHKTAMDSLKALRIALGQDEYDSLLAQGIKKIAGGDADDATSAFGKDIPEPAHFSQMKPETKQQVLATFDYHFKRVLPGLMQSVVAGVMRSLDDRDAKSVEERFAEENEDYEDLKEAMDAYRQEHGITGKSKRTLAWLLNQVKEDAKEAARQLGGETGSKFTKKIGRPRPKGSSRGQQGKPQELKTDADFEHEFEQRQAAKEKG